MQHPIMFAQRLKNNSNTRKSACVDKPLKNTQKHFSSIYI